MTTPDHAAIQARLDAATYAFPWASESATKTIRDADGWMLAAKVGPTVAELIAHAPADLAALLVENQRLRDTIQAVREAEESFRAQVRDRTIKDDYRSAMLDAATAIDNAMEGVSGE